MQGMKNEIAFLNKAYKLSKRSTLSRFGHGAVLVKDGKIISEGWSHLSDMRLTEYISIHAEVHALFRANRKDLMASTIYVVAHSKKSFNRSKAKPCRQCAAFLFDCGVKEIVYSVDDKTIARWRHDDDKEASIDAKTMETWI